MSKDIPKGEKALIDERRDGPGATYVQARKALDLDGELTVYIAGPMRGHDLHNFPAFDEARDRFKGSGWTVESPADLDRAVGFTEHTKLPDDPERLEAFLDECMDRDLEAVRRSDSIALLPGWEDSEGAAVELAYAKYRGLEVLDADTMRPFADETVLDEAARIVNGSRRKRYGHPQDNFARTAQILNGLLGPKLASPLEAQDVAMVMVGVKLARQGNSPNRDNLVDIAGYAMACSMCEENEQDLGE